MMRRLVGRHAMFAAVDGETRVRDAVRVAADDRTEIRRRVEVRLETIESEDDVRGGAIGHRARASDAMMHP